MEYKEKPTQEMIDLYDDYTHGPLPRREFMTRLAKLAGGAAAAASVLPLIAPNYELQQVRPNDERVTYAGPSGRSCYKR